PDAGPDAGDPSCPLERWPTAVSIVTGAVLEPEISLATSETGELGHVHVGMIANGRARIVTRDLDVLEAPRDPPSDDLGTRWSLIADRSIALHRDRDAGDVHVLVLHDGIDGDDGVRASVGSLSAGAASSTTAPTRVMGPATHLTLGRAAILGGTEGLPRRYVWRNRIAVGNTVLASVAEDVASDYHEVPGVSHEDLAEVRGSSGRWTLAESPSDGLLLWDGSAAPPEPVAASGRASRIGFAYEGGGAYLLGYHDGAVMHVRRAACSEACVLGTESTYPIGAPPGAHVSLERLAGYVALGYANPARVELHMQLLTPALEQVRGTETPLSVEVRVGRGVVDVAVARVRHRGDEHLVFAYLAGPSGSAPDEVYLTGARFPSSCP
ncbi:MAG: hypothetical protein IT379_09525, partial [Deltaproteobacteria bacterium]|nr:hypothetical protein [Deltaproteobacteria bacterium]